jgi:hypothetical protein
LLKSFDEQKLILEVVPEQILEQAMLVPTKVFPQVVQSKQEPTMEPTKVEPVD